MTPEYFAEQLARMQSPLLSSSEQGNLYTNYGLKDIIRDIACEDKWLVEEFFAYDEERQPVVQLLLKRKEDPDITIFAFSVTRQHLVCAYPNVRNRRSARNEFSTNDVCVKIVEHAVFQQQNRSAKERIMKEIMYDEPRDGDEKYW